jgi:hypothetical protein
VQRTFSVGEPVHEEATWIAYPSPDTVLYVFMIVGTSLRDNKGSMRLPPTLHESLSISVDSRLRSVAQEVKFASTGTNLMEATEVTTLPESGESVLIDNHSERVRADIWVHEKTYLVMP